MSFLSKLFGGGKEERPVPAQYDTPWDVVEAFVADPQWQVEVLERRDGWLKIRFNNVVGEALDDPDGEWLHLRFRIPFTDEQKQSELACYEWWSNYCARNTQFRWDIDLEAQEYYGDAFALIAGQYDQIECIRAIFNSAVLLNGNANRIALARTYSVKTGKYREPAVVLALWQWFDGLGAPLGTKLQHASYRERSYLMGSAVGSVVQEQWSYYALMRFTASDFMPYIDQSDDRRLKLYKMHLAIQRQFPRIRNFIAATATEKDNGFHETSLAIVISSGTEASAIFERCVKDVYNALLAYTEWFNFDFTPTTAPWFDHSVKKPQDGYERLYPGAVTLTPQELQ
jgi:hypothetical protein